MRKWAEGEGGGGVVGACVVWDGGWGTASNLSFQPPPNLSLRYMAAT
jgi:hypothetical protein